MQESHPSHHDDSHVPWYRAWFKVILLGSSILFLVVIGLAVHYFYSTYQQIEAGTIDLSAFSQEGALSKVNEEEAKKIKNIDNSYVNNIKGDPSIGPQDAQLTVVMFEDFECPYCGQTFRPLKTIIAKYKDRVKFVYRDFPVTDSHPHAQQAAEAAQCAHEQGKFWLYHDLLYSNQAALTPEDLQGYAQQLNMNMEGFTKCVESEKYKNEVEEDMEDGLQAGVLGTPTFFFNGNPVSGAVTEEQLEYIIQIFLEESI